MTRLLSVCAVVVALAFAFACDRPTALPAAPASSVGPAPDTEGVKPPSERRVMPDEPTLDPEPLRRHAVLVYYPSASRLGLVGEVHEIYMTAAPNDRAKQIVADLIAGPNSDEALPLLSPNTRLRQIYVLPDGTAWVDLSSEVRASMRGGSSEERYLVYSIVDSLALNIPEIRRVGILIDGQPIETLTGHMDLRRPLPPDRSVIVGTLDT